MGRYPAATLGLGVFALLTMALGCGSGGEQAAAGAPDGAAPAIGDGLPDGCSPLRPAGACMMPFPNAIWLDPDASKKTGYRVAFSADTLPATSVKKAPLDPATLFNRADGFSPATPILAYFPDRIDAASLVPPGEVGKSLEAGSATVLVDMETRQRVAHFAEVDMTAANDDDRQALILRPARRLRPGTRYAVAVTRSIRKVGGGVPASPPSWASISAGQPPPGAMAARQVKRMPDILAAIEAAGVARGELVVAWDFVTGSDEWVTQNVLSMRDRALAVAGQDGIAFKVVSVEENFNAKILRRVRGTFTVPQFVSQTDPKVPKAVLAPDAEGKPAIVGQYEAPFTVLVPMAAKAKAPLPIVVYGHGLLGSGEGELGGAGGSYVQDFADAKGYVIVATDWTGLSQYESPTSVDGSAAAAEAVSDFNRLPWITDRLQQALVNQMVLVRTMRGRIVKDAALTVSGVAGGPSAADGGKVHYYGISLGAIMGGALLGYCPDLARGVVNVGGGGWSHMFQRSSNWRAFVLVIGASYPDRLDQQLLLALAQMPFDFSDPITVAPHIVLDPLPGVPKKQVLAQMAVGDAQVPNLASMLFARTAGLPLLAPAVVAPWDMPPTAGPLPSAFSTWDVHPQPVPPETNATPAADNAAHEAIRRLPRLMDQIEKFFATGEVVSTCEGPCDPE